ncbi:hypothetical protein GGR51DRAFT_475879 [Nemania sp. FL0031]|nr:hypothetical protein GGR51DRAFT_475879 [Nemania sp. FL0031]
MQPLLLHTANQIQPSTSFFIYLSTLLTYYTTYCCCCCCCCCCYQHPTILKNTNTCYTVPFIHRSIVPQLEPPQGFLPFPLPCCALLSSLVSVRTVAEALTRWSGAAKCVSVVSVALPFSARPPSLLVVVPSLTSHGICIMRAVAYCPWHSTFS